MGERKIRYTEEQYQYARYEANVVDYALGRGYHLVKSGPHYRLAEHDSMVFTPDGRWFWNSRALQGRAIEFAMHYEGMTLPEAVLSICGAQRSTAMPQSSGMPAHAASRQPEKREFRLPEKAPNTKQLFAYLCGTRGLDREIVAQLVRDGDLYESVYHGQTDVFNAVFVGRDANGTPRSAFQRGLLSYASSPAYKRDVAGSDPAAAFRLAGRGEVDTVIVFEAAIDAISHASICKADGLDWQSCDRIALGGTQKGVGLEAYLEAHPQVRNVTLSFDADDAGRAASDRWEDWLEAFDYKVTRLAPTAGKDWNETLQERKREENLDNKTAATPIGRIEFIDSNGQESHESIEYSDAEEFEKAIRGNSGRMRVVVYRDASGDALSPTRQAERSASAPATDALADSARQMVAERSTELDEKLEL